MWFRRLTTVIAASMVLGATTPVTPPVVADESTVKIKDAFFTPVFKVIGVGDTVTWLNEGEIQHTATTFDDAPAPFDSSPGYVPPDCSSDAAPPSLLEEEEEQSKECMDPGESFTFTFAKAGTYNYYCKPHVLRGEDGEPVAEPDPNISAQKQPCGMCGQIVVKKAATPTKAARATKKPSSSSSGGAAGTATPTRSAVSPSRSASPSASPSAGATIDASGNPVAQQKPDDGNGGGGGLVLALLAILALSGAGYATWRRFLATR